MSTDTEQKNPLQAAVGSLTLLAVTFAALFFAGTATAGVVHEKTWILKGGDPMNRIEAVASTNEGVVAATLTGDVYAGGKGGLKRLVDNQGVWASDIAVGPDGSIYLLTESGVIRYAADGTRISSWGGPSFGQFEDFPAIEVMEDGTVLISSRLKGVIRRYGPDGKNLGRWGGGGRPSIGDPIDLAADADGTVYVADGKTQRIRVLVGGKTVRSFGKRGWRPGRIDWIEHIATDREGHVFVSESPLERVQVFGTEGNPLGQFGRSGGGPYNFLWVSGIAAGPDGKLLVAGANVMVKQYRLREGPFRRYAGILSWTLDWNKYLRPGQKGRIPFIAANFATARARGVTYCIPRREFRQGFLLGNKRCRGVGAIAAGAAKRFFIRVRAPLPGDPRYLPCCSLDFGINVKSANAGSSLALSQIFLKVRRGDRG